MQRKSIIGFIPEVDEYTEEASSTVCTTTENISAESVQNKKDVVKQNLDHNKSDKQPEKTLRAAGGVVWEDPTLADWDPSHFRIFVGDLGRDVSDDLLYSTFHADFPSTTKARVVRDKHTGRSRGFGFVALSNEEEFKAAIRSLHGKYIGSRPVKLRKSTWSDRNVESDKVGQLKKIGYKVVKPK
jgi:RNA recognition motif-containing protein